jgi:ElaB/YqjD/DUF883 family membrane-anchored ribosome-binding protein
MKNVLQIVFLTIVVAGVAAAGEGYVVATPEIGVGTAVSACGLLAGALLLLRARSKK